MSLIREQWGTRAGFILASAGSMIGLGSLWRFPYVAYDNGGGAFLIPYLIALLTAGIPLLIMEYAIGHKTRTSAALAFQRLGRAAAPIGWWQVAICFVVAIYYAVIIAWAIRYIGFSVSLQWGGNPQRFLNEEFLRVAEQPGQISTYVSGVLWPLVAVWIITLGILALGVRRGIETSNRIFVPLLVVLFGILVVHSLTLEGASIGLDALFRPDWSAIGDPRVWLAAYGQTFFTLSVGFGIMVTYASYAKSKADLTGSALVAAFSNAGVEILAGIGVFAALGFMSATTTLPVDDVASQGVGLAFVAFPQIISQLPAGAHLFGVLFFLSLVLAGLASLISIVQVVVAAVQDRVGLSRVPAVLLVGGVIAATSIALFPTDQGLMILDVVDHFINDYGIVGAALVSIVVVGWAMRRLPEMGAHANATSVLNVGWSWMIVLGAVTPLALGWIVYESVLAEAADAYNGYPQWFVNLFGWGAPAATIAVALLLSILPWRDPQRVGLITFQKGRQR
ncbi:sodium-dependent transporter [Stackebrandtia soli]|uniref:sodium-dependent transporter n=1 Tax=Stackebrandtia soli TaxID=1892856 RepID=UPI0039EAE8DF